MSCGAIGMRMISVLGSINQSEPPDLVLRSLNANSSANGTVIGESLSDFTLCGWFRVNSWTGGTQSVFYVQPVEGSGDLIVSANIGLDSLTVYFWDGGDIETSLSLSDNTTDWFYAAISMSGDTGKIRILKSGETTFITNTENLSAWGAGRKMWVWDSLYDRQCENIDATRIRIFNSELSDSDLLTEAHSNAPVLIPWASYPFISATDWELDTSGNNRHLTSEGSPTEVQDQPEDIIDGEEVVEAASINANSTAYGTRVGPSGDLTASGWFRVNEWTGNEFQIMIYVQPGSGSGDLAFEADIGSGNLLAYFWDGDAIEGQEPHPDETPTDWVYGAVSISGTTGKIRILRTGESTFVTNTFDLTNWGAGARNIWFWNDPYSEQCENVDATRIRIFNSELSDSALLAEARSDTPVSTTWASYPFKSATGWELDVSGNNRHLTTSGTPIEVSEQPEDITDGYEVSQELKLFIAGSSIINGRINDENHFAEAPGRSLGLSALRNDSEVVNTAEDGRTIADMITFYNSEILPFKDPSKRNIIIAYEFNNSLWGGGTGDPPVPNGISPEAAMEEAEEYADMVKDDGFEILWCTLLPIDYPSEQVLFDEVNILLRASTAFDGLIECDTMVAFENPGWPHNENYQDDGHLNDVGLIKLTNFIDNYLDSYI